MKKTPAQPTAITPSRIPKGVLQVAEDNKKALAQNLSYGKMKQQEAQRSSLCATKDGA